jgi:hypothetical protein
MIPIQPNDTQVLAFTQRLIAHGMADDKGLYRALVSAYATLVATQTVDDPTLLARLFDRPCLTPATLLAQINALIAAQKG